MMNIDKVSEFLKGEEEWVESGKNRIVVFYTGKRHGYGQDSNVVWDIGRAYEPDAIKNKYIAFIRYQRIDFGDEDE